jgi:hypothetical protein
MSISRINHSLFPIIALFGFLGLVCLQNGHANEERLFLFSQQWQTSAENETEYHFDFFKDGIVEEKDLLLLLMDLKAGGNSIPVLSLEPEALVFGSTETQAYFEIVNSGSGMLSWTLQESESWLECHCAQGDTVSATAFRGVGEERMAVQVDRTGLSMGDYEGTIEIASNVGFATVSVRLTVVPLIEEEIVELPGLPEGAQPLVLVHIPPLSGKLRSGSFSFLMGRYPNEQDSSMNEDPQHEVVFAHRFWISKYEVTQAQWKAVMGENPSIYQGDLVGYANTDNWRVENVGWADTQALFIKLNELNPGMNFRLPSEAEWEFCCRAGTTTRFYWGDDPDLVSLPNYAWTVRNSMYGPKPVGTRLPNPWGLYDMSGNVLEWVQDCGNISNYEGAPVDGSAWECSVRGTSIVRGGSYRRFDGNLRAYRSAWRAALTPSDKQDHIGFRLAR